MKSILVLLAVILSFGLFAQTPAGVNYQAVARDGDGELLTDESVTVRFALRPVAGGNDVYVETQQLVTNAYGLFSAVIGEGSANQGAFADLDWSVAYELGVAVNGTDLGYTVLQSVPYALNAGPREYAIGVPASVFTPNNNAAAFRNSIGTGGVTITSTAGTAVTTVLNAPMPLPHGSRVTSLTVYYTDNSTEEMRIWLAKEFYRGSFSIVAEHTTQGAEETARQNTVAVNHLVDNSDGAYFIRVFCSDWETPGQKVVRGVRVTYTY